MLLPTLFLALLPTQKPPTHWAFHPPLRPALPDVGHSGPANGNPIDFFIHDRLQRAGLALSPPAERTTLIRRVTLDLTGLPPTPAEVDAFVRDPAPDAYERVVSRLLASPRYGERMAARWLDAARYADTCGYQNDGERIMWRWRDWVIDAFNANMPFDQFTIEQLAGDLLPGATVEQRIATGFNRNHRGNAEGGIIPEEYAVEYVVDRVDTTATVWLGLTLGCARCHDHKYDPFTQREYYQLFAFFNSIAEHGRAVKYGNSPPFIPTPTSEQQRRLAAIDARIADAARRVARLEPQLRTALAHWEQQMPAAPLRWSPTRRLIKSIDKPGEFDGSRVVVAGDTGDFGYLDKFTLAARFKSDDVRSGAILSRMPEAPESEGYCLRLHEGRVRVELTKRYLDDALRVETVRQLKDGEWHHVAVTYDGSRLARGVQIFIDGQPEKTIVLLDELNQTFANGQPLRVGSGGGPATRFRGLIADVRIHDDTLTPDEVAWLADERPLQSAAPLKRQAYFLEHGAPREIAEAHHQLFELGLQRRALVESFPTTMVMQELATPRPAFVLKRGEYDKRGEPVQRGLPAVLAGGKAARNRLDLARWLVAPENPLTARVAVNRLWQQFFGTGLVKTTEDFGTRGEPPSHPELLDWLATEYLRGGWDTKALVRLIVTSATYRQSSRATPERLAKDAENRLLSRGPRLRLSAEMIRDQALAASGLLVERLGGPSVRPYQPAGLGKELGAEEYAAERGANLYRRGLYTFWKRTVAPPNMTAFDAAGRETCSVREVRTNTPLQALTLLNDVTFVEAARKLAERSMKEGGATPESRVMHAFRLVLARRPTVAESSILVAGFHDHLRAYRHEPRSARSLLSAGESPRDPRLEDAELAAYTATAALILNLDEAVTKE